MYYINEPLFDDDNTGEVITVFCPFIIQLLFGRGLLNLASLLLHHEENEKLDHY
jgi:hypothetical protein